MLYRGRFNGKISEAFIESQATLRIQIGFYLAFSFIISQKWGQTECIAQTIIGHELGIFKFDNYNFLGVPVLLFSSITSLLSVTFAQCNLYQSKHEFDMSLLGKLLYFFSSLGVAFCKISAQVMFVMALNAWTLSQIDMSPGLEWALILMPHIIIHISHNIKELFINYWTAKPNSNSPGGGYYLESKMLVATGRRYCMEQWRFLPGQEKTLLPRTRSRNLMRNIVNYLIQCWNTVYWYLFLIWTRTRHWSWNCCILIPCHSARVHNNPDVYGFERGISSRKKFRQRFMMALGKKSSNVQHKLAATMY